VAKETVTASWSQAHFDFCTTTMFFLLLWFPLIPVKTYRVEDRGWKLVWLERLPLDWRQVRRVWATAGGLVLSFILLVAGMWVVGYIRRM
jgi:hypothetical protein